MEGAGADLRVGEALAGDLGEAGAHVGDGMGRRCEAHVDIEEQGIGDGDVLYEPGGFRAEGLPAFPAEEAGLMEGDEGAAEADGEMPDGLDGAGVLLDAVGAAASGAEAFAEAGLLP